MSKQNVSIGLLLALIVLINSCANIVAPTGGSKDTDPPVVTRIHPPNEEVLFFDNRIEIEFDEYVRLNDVKNQMVVSPPFPQEPEIKLKGKKLMMDIPDSLSEGTTYVINFGDAIVDLNEGNELSNYKYIFSTGPYLDSLKLKGKVIDGLTQQGREGIFVLVYDQDYDSIPFLERPYYFSKTDGSGNFEIGFMRSGSYKAIALKDDNGNYLYDLPEEEIGFVDKQVQPSASGAESPALFKLFGENHGRMFVKGDDYQDPGFLQIVMSKPAPGLQVEFLQPADPETIDEHSENRDTLNFWFAKNPPSEILLVIHAEDFTDTLNIDLDKRDSKDTLVKVESNVQSFELNKVLEFETEHPITNLTKANMKLIADSAEQPFHLNQKDDSPRLFTMDSDWSEETRYKVQLLPGAISTLNSSRHDTLEFNFQTKKVDDYGTLSLDLILEEEKGPFVLQMLDGKGKIVTERTRSQSGRETFEYLLPKKFSFRLIHDTNNNGKWDTGNYLEGIQPEQVVVMPDKVEIRANWELELEWEPKE